MCDMSRFDDSSSFDAEMNRYIQDICDMGIMGRNGTKTALV